MRKSRIARISIPSGTAALCMAIASPATACVVPGDFAHAGFSQSVDPVAAAIASADRGISFQMRWLTYAANKVSTDPNLTSAQQTQFAGDVAAETTALQAETAVVDAATTTDAVKAGLDSAAVKTAATVVGLDLAITGGNDYIVGEENGLTRQAAKVAAETDLTSGQQADLVPMFTAAQATLASARTSVNGATTAAAIRTIEKSTHAPLDAINLKLAIDRADNEITAAQTQLSTWAAQVQAATDLTPQEQTDALAKITAAQNSLTALKTKVDAATSTGQVSSLMRTAHFGDKPWSGCDPSKLPRLSPAQVAAMKHTTPNHPTVVTPQNKPVTLVTQKSQTSSKSSSNSGGRNGGSNSSHSSHGRGRGSHH